MSKITFQQEHIAEASRIMDLPEPDPKWAWQAPCSESSIQPTNPEAVSSQRGSAPAVVAEEEAFIRAFCNKCQVKDACISEAVRNGEEYGVWGGRPNSYVRRVILAHKAILRGTVKRPEISPSDDSASNSSN